MAAGIEGCAISIVRNHERIQGCALRVVRNHERASEDAHSALSDATSGRTIVILTRRVSYVQERVLYECVPDSWSRELAKRPAVWPEVWARVRAVRALFLDKLSEARKCRSLSILDAPPVMQRKGRDFHNVLQYGEMGTISEGIGPRLDRQITDRRREMPDTPDQVFSRRRAAAAAQGSDAGDCGRNSSPGL